MKTALRALAAFFAYVILSACDRDSGGKTSTTGVKPARATQKAATVTVAASKTASLSDWEKLMAEAEANCPDDASRQQARFQILQRLLSGINAEQYAEAAKFVREHYKTGLQSALLEYVTESLAGRTTSLGNLLTVIQSWPPGSGRWASVRILASRLPPGALDELMRSLTTSGLPEERAAVIDGLRNRLTNGGSEEFAALRALSAEWGEQANALLRSLEPKYARNLKLSEGLTRFSDDPTRLADFLGNYSARHRGEVSRWLLGGEAPEKLLTGQNLMIAVHDGMDSPEATGSALDRLKLADETSKELAAETFVARWMQHDPDAASRWLRSTSSVEIRKGGGKAILGYLQRMGDTESFQEWQRWLNTGDLEGKRLGQ